MASAHDETTKTMTEATTDPPNSAPADGPPKPAEAKPPSHRWRKWLVWIGLAVGVAVGGYYLKPVVETGLNTVSTDDAYVNGHVTLVAPRVSGQVSRVLVDDDDRVKKGALLIQLDKEPFEDQVELKKAAVAVAEADVLAAHAQMRGLIAQLQTDRFQLERAIEDVHTQVANLRSNIATLKSRQATLELAGNNFRRGEELSPSGGISKEELDQRRQSVKVAQAALDQALEAVLASRVGLGLPAQPPTGRDLGVVPDDLDQNYSAIRQALGQVYRSASLLGFAPPSWVLSPKQALDIFERQDPERNLDRIFANLSAQAPSIKQAETKLQQARARPRAGRARPPLLRRQERDRRRGDQPKRQPRQQCPGRAKPPGRPLAHRDLDRRQLQGDSTGGLAHRPSGAL